MKADSREEPINLVCGHATLHVGYALAFGPHNPGPPDSTSNLESDMSAVCLPISH